MFCGRKYPPPGAYNNIPEFTGRQCEERTYYQLQINHVAFFPVRIEQNRIAFLVISFTKKIELTPITTWSVCIKTDQINKRIMGIYTLDIVQIIFAGLENNEYCTCYLRSCQRNAGLCGQTCFYPGSTLYKSTAWRQTWREYLPKHNTFGEFYLCLVCVCVGRWNILIKKINNFSLIIMIITNQGWGGVKHHP